MPYYNKSLWLHVAKFRVTEEASVAETAVWPITFLVNIFTALSIKDLFYFNLLLLQLVLCSVDSTGLCVELWTIRILANSTLVNRTLKNSALVNSDPDNWSIRTVFIGQFGPQKEKNSLVNLDLFHW